MFHFCSLGYLPGHIVSGCSSLTNDDLFFDLGCFSFFPSLFFLYLCTLTACVLAHISQDASRGALRLRRIPMCVPYLDSLGSPLTLTAHQIWGMGVTSLSGISRQPFSLRLTTTMEQRRTTRRVTRVSVCFVRGWRNHVYTYVVGMYVCMYVCMRMVDWYRAYDVDTILH
jgi:hypothetical protein